MPVTRMRGLRIPDTRWDAAGARATTEGTNLSAVINGLLEQYASGAITPPVLPVATPAAAPSAEPIPAALG